MIILIFCFILLTKPKINIKYNNKNIDNEITINVFDTFEYPTVEGKYLRKNISNKITYNKSVNTSKVGK